MVIRDHYVNLYDYMYILYQIMLLNLFWHGFTQVEHHVLLLFSSIFSFTSVQSTPGESHRPARPQELVGSTAQGAWLATPGRGGASPKPVGCSLGHVTGPYVNAMGLCAG